MALEREPNILVDFFWCCCSPWHGTNNNYHSSGKSRDSLASERQQRRTVLAIYTIDGVRILIKFHLSSISHFCHIARNIGIGACVVKSFRAIATNEIDSWYFWRTGANNDAYTFYTRNTVAGNVTNRGKCARKKPTKASSFRMLSGMPSWRVHFNFYHSLILIP